MTHYQVNSKESFTLETLIHLGVSDTSSQILAVTSSLHPCMGSHRPDQPIRTSRRLLLLCTPGQQVLEK